MVNTVHDTFATLLKEENFGEIILVAWAYVEYMINQLTIENFNIKQEDTKTKEFLTDRSFEDKWNFVKALGIFTEKEKKKISTFQTRRNKLFHDALFNDIDYYRPEGRKRLIELAKGAFYAVSEAHKRKWNNYDRR